MALSVPYQAPDEDIFGLMASELVAKLPERLSTRVLENAKRLAEHPAIVDGEVRWSYAELGDEIRAARRWLEGLGLRPGDRLMTVSENGRALVVLLLAASEMDVWVAIINSRLSAQEVDLIRDNCLPRRIIYTCEASEDAARHAERQGADHYQHPQLGGLALSALLDSDPEPVSENGAEQVAAMIYTSGTTGTPKGVMLTHRGILYIASD